MIWVLTVLNRILVCSAELRSGDSGSDLELPLHSLHDYVAGPVLGSDQLSQVKPVLTAVVRLLLNCCCVAAAREHCGSA